MKQSRRDILMQGSGVIHFEIPTGMKYVAVLNNTDNSIEVYQKQVTVSDLQAALVDVVPYQNITVPIRDGQGQQFSVIWTDGGIVNEKRVTLIFADENLGINAQTGSMAGSSNVSIISESVGLARQAQLPAALTGGGNLKTEIMNTPAVTISGTISQLPDVLTASGNLKTTGAEHKGTHLNAWNSSAVSAGGVSNISDDLWYSKLVTVFGNTSAATDITVQFSENGSTFFDSEIKKVGVTGNFGFTFDFAARYVRLKSSAAVTISATISAK